MIVSGGSEPYQLIEEELSKIRCKECKKDIANYFVYNNGFFCTLCFSKLKGAESAQLHEFANILDKSVTDYKKQKNSPTAAFNVISEEIKKKYESLKTKRDQLQGDIITQKNKTLQRIDFLNEACIAQNMNEPLEQLYEPSLKVSSNMSITDILQRNLQNLRLRHENDQTIYEFQQKDTKATNQTVNNKMDLIKTSLESLRRSSAAVIDEYYKGLEQLKK